MIKIVDKRCDLCNKIYENVDDNTDTICECGGELKRLFGYNKPMQMLPHWEENMGHEPVWIEDREHYNKEAKKRGLYQVPLKKPKKVQYFI